MKCYKCGKEMTDEHGASVIGVSIVARDSDEFMKKQWGKHHEDASKEDGINICYECWIDTLLGTKEEL